ncbi:unnamed protein product [Urochloa humidicola]
MPEWLNRRWWRGAASLGSRRAPAVGRADEPMEWWMPDVDRRRQALGSSDSELEREGGTVARSRPPAAPPPPRSVGDFDFAIWGNLQVKVERSVNDSRKKKGLGRSVDLMLIGRFGALAF